MSSTTAPSQRHEEERREGNFNVGTNGVTQNPGGGERTKAGEGSGELRRIEEEERWREGEVGWFGPEMKEEG